MLGTIIGGSLGRENELGGSPVRGTLIGGGIGLAILASCLLCLVRHMENIGRLIGGTESKLVWKWKK